MQKLYCKTIIVVLLFVITNYSKGQGYNIDIKIDGLKDTAVILGHYFDKKIIVNDTIIVDKNGSGIFSGEKKLPEGLYVIYLPDKNYFDFLLGADQSLSISTTNYNLVNNMKISGAKESQQFLNHKIYLENAHKNIAQIQSQIQLIKNNNDSIEILKKQIQELHNKTISYWDKAIIETKGTFLSTFLKALQDIKVPEITIDEHVSNKDSILQIKKYYYYKNHYFDNIDLTDDRILRTPFFTSKVESFFNNTVIQIPDTLAKEAIKLIEKCRPNNEMFKYMIQHLFNYSIESKMMGMDLLVVEIGEKYYLSGEATWASQEFLKDLEERVTLLKPTLLGKKAHDLKMESPSGEFFKLSEVDAKYTILIFWEPHCGHCKKEIPKVHNEVWSKYKDKGVKVFAVYTQTDKEEWSTFLNEHNLNDWINVYDPYHSSHFRNYFDISSTPVIYVLDKDKKIVAKKIGADNLPGFFEHEIKYGRL
ncbi:MAG: AhpC/TSA family protein [Marinilabiliaceae bacterium]|nr:AhpC/TSA family protein [Marinilabiliaceae bacterium]